jgi:calmodulin
MKKPNYQNKNEKIIKKQELDIPEGEEEQYRDAFMLFDKNGDGTISHVEFYKVLKNLGQSVTMEECKKIVKDLDQDNSGEISFDEFISYMKLITIQVTEEDEDEIIKAFQTFDVDKDDKISKAEFRHILCNIGENKFTIDECDLLFKEADIDNDDHLNYREFVGFWRRR